MGARRLKDALELVSRSDLQLIVSAICRRLVRPPPQERRRMAKAIALHVVVLHFAHALDPSGSHDRLCLRSSGFARRACGRRQLMASAHCATVGVERAVA